MFILQDKVDVARRVIRDLDRDVRFRANCKPPAEVTGEAHALREFAVPRIEQRRGDNN
jgi:hypothetical protein